MNNILIVEDNPAVYYTLELILKDNGYDVVVAERLADAERLLDIQSFDLVLLDRNLPDGKGDLLLDHIRQDLGLHIPVLITSATLQANSVSNLMNAGANGYLVKPFNVEELLTLIKHWMRRHVAN